MTYLIEAVNVNDAYHRARALIRRVGQPLHTRNGPAYRAPHPVVTSYAAPMERVLLDPVRDANPFFHVFEALWILAGRNDVHTLGYFNGRISTYSDNGAFFHGAYGWRLRRAFGVDQLQRAAELLRANPNDRRVVLSIWHPSLDLGTDSKDIPCNDMLKLAVREDTWLDLTVFNRSNDILWGCYGANAVQFAFLLEYMAAAAGLRPGMLHQVSTDWHWYGSLPEHPGYDVPDPYRQHDLSWVALLAPGETVALLDDDIALFWYLVTAGRPSEHRDSFATRWMRTVAWPLWQAWLSWKTTWPDGAPKERRELEARRHAQLCAASDWRWAATAWLDRRRTN